MTLTLDTEIIGRIHISGRQRLSKQSMGEEKVAAGTAQRISLPSTNDIGTAGPAHVTQNGALFS